MRRLPTALTLGRLLIDAALIPRKHSGSATLMSIPEDSELQGLRADLTDSEILTRTGIQSSDTRRLPAEPPR